MQTEFKMYQIFTDGIGNDHKIEIDKQETGRFPYPRFMKTASELKAKGCHVLVEEVVTTIVQIGTLRAGK